MKERYGINIEESALIERAIILKVIHYLAEEHLITLEEELRMQEHITKSEV